MPDSLLLCADSMISMAASDEVRRRGGDQDVRASGTPAGNGARFGFPSPAPVAYLLRPIITQPAVPMRFALAVLLATYAVSMRMLAQSETGPDEMLIDATWVPCSDTTESLFIFRDGRAIFARHDQGIIFNIGSGLLADIVTVIERSKSITETEKLDSCTTLGVITQGPRFMLINTMRPSIHSRDVHARLERLRKYSRRKLDRMDQLAERASVLPDTSIESAPTFESETLAGLIYSSPVAAEWRCRGAVVVTAMVGVDGRVRRAFVEDARVRGKCASLLTMTALRAVLLAPFQPATRTNGKEAAAWKKVEVVFGARRMGATNDATRMQ